MFSSSTAASRENIARFQRPLDAEAVLAAARAAGFHEQILALPDGYETRIGLGRIELSAGQKQRLVWRAPFMATRFWSCSTSPIPISTPTASGR